MMGIRPLAVAEIFTASKDEMSIGIENIRERIQEIPYVSIQQERSDGNAASDEESPREGSILRAVISSRNKDSCYSRVLILGNSACYRESEAEWAASKKLARALLSEGLCGSIFLNQEVLKRSLFGNKFDPAIQAANDFFGISLLHMNAMIDPSKLGPLVSGLDPSGEKKLYGSETWNKALQQFKRSPKFLWALKQ